MVATVVTDKGSEIGVTEDGLGYIVGMRTREQAEDNDEDHWWVEVRELRHVVTLVQTLIEGA
jgi:hypothetical protein